MTRQHFDEQRQMRDKIYPTYHFPEMIKALSEFGIESR